MTYLEKARAELREMQENLRRLPPVGPPHDMLAKQIEIFKQRDLEWARDADEFDPAKDEIQIFLVSFELHKRQDATGKTEFYFSTTMVDEGDHAQEPEIYLLERYHQMRKGDVWRLEDPMLVYSGAPGGSISYSIDCFDTQRTNHDNTVEAIPAIVEAVGEGGAAFTALVNPVAGLGVAAGSKVASKVTDAIVQAAKDHEDEHFEGFVGTLIERDERRQGPYSLAEQNRILKSERITVTMRVDRNPGARQSARSRRPRAGLKRVPLRLGVSSPGR